MMRFSSMEVNGEIVAFIWTLLRAFNSLPVPPCRAIAARDNYLNPGETAAERPRQLGRQGSRVLVLKRGKAIALGLRSGGRRDAMNPGLNP
jgi:hypothetical protein